MKKLFICFLLAGCASGPPKSGISWEQVRVVEQTDESCKFVRQEVCNTKRTNGVARCHKWVKVRAASFGADTVVLLSSNQEGRVFGNNVGIFSGSTTTVMADYYSCRQQ